MVVGVVGVVGGGFCGGWCCSGSGLLADRWWFFESVAVFVVNLGASMKVKNSLITHSEK